MFRSPILTVLLLMAVLLLAMGTARAELSPQLAAPPETLADAFLTGLVERVPLSPQERAAVRLVLIEQIKRRQDVVRARLAATPGRAGMLALRQDLGELNRETDAKLAAILPPEKMAAVGAYREERRQQVRRNLEETHSRQQQAQRGE